MDRFAYRHSQSVPGDARNDPQRFWDGRRATGADRAQLYMIDPSGVSYGYWGCAIGKARQAAKTEIEKLQMKEMTCRDVVKEVAKIIYIVHDEVKDKAFELELSWVGELTKGRHEIVPKDIREEAEKYAKESLKEEDESDDDNM